MKCNISKTCLVIAFSLNWIGLFAQQDSQYSQYMFTPYTVNPAAVGSDNMAHIYGGARLHQVGLDAEEKRTSAGFIFPFNISKLKNGFGILVTDDKFAYSKNLTIRGNYALQFKLDDKGINNLGIGLGLGVLNGMVDNSLAKNSNTSLPWINTGKFTSTSIDLGVGIFFTSSRFFCGISANHLNSPKIPIENLTYSLKRTVYVASGYLMPISDSRFSFYPSFLVQTEFTTTQVALSGVLDYNQMFWIGGAYRIDDAATALVGFKLFKSLKVGYSYDYLLSPLGKYSNGSHEIFLTYSFSLKRDKTPSQYKSIRFL
jgi:type IX secretion system PorP/SprF family membrane protein